VSGPQNFWSIGRRSTFDGSRILLGASLLRDNNGWSDYNRLEVMNIHLDFFWDGSGMLSMECGGIIITKKTYQSRTRIYITEQERDGFLGRSFSIQNWKNELRKIGRSYPDLPVRDWGIGREAGKIRNRFGLFPLSLRHKNRQESTSAPRPSDV